MSDRDRRRWDEKYRTGAYVGRDHPTRLLVEWQAGRAPGRALDVACGAGRNSVFLAANEWRVDAVDISAAGLERARQKAESQALAIHWIQADLEERGNELPEGPYDLIVVVRYVNRTLTPHLLKRLAPGGLLVCEQHLDTSEPVIGPQNPDFRLRPNELLHQVTGQSSGLRLLYYREGTAEDPDGRLAALAQLVASRESPARDVANACGELIGEEPAPQD